MRKNYCQLINYKVCLMTTSLRPSFAGCFSRKYDKEVRDNFAKIIKFAGGEIEDERFVTKPGVRIIKETQATPEFDTLLDSLNISLESAPYEKCAEFSARICYLSFPKDKETPEYAKAYNQKMVDYGHTSVYNDYYVTFLIAGICDETVKELLAHVEHRASRLTSSKTNSQNTTLYRVQGTLEEMEQQKTFIREFLKLRSITSMNKGEFNNINNLGSKAALLEYTMSLKDFRKMITGRLPEFGNETEIREVVQLMQTQLRERYPLLFSQ